MPDHTYNTGVYIWDSSEAGSEAVKNAVKRLEEGTNNEKVIVRSGDYGITSWNDNFMRLLNGRSKVLVVIPKDNEELGRYLENDSDVVAWEHKIKILPIDYSDKDLENVIVGAIEEKLDAAELKSEWVGEGEELNG